MEIFGEHDVVVVGGGTSDVAAAIAATRVGTNTLLIERLGCLGGQMNVSGPPGFSYYYPGEGERYWQRDRIKLCLSR